MYNNNTSITQQQYSRSNDYGDNNNINSSSNSGNQRNKSNSYRTSPAPTSVQSQSTPSTMFVQSPQAINPQTTIVPQLSQSRQSSYIVSIHRFYFCTNNCSRRNVQSLFKTERKQRFLFFYCLFFPIFYM